ncbi:unnamed protein product, partial [Ectocarpus sp. 6 AP-2014]
MLSRKQQWVRVRAPGITRRRPTRRQQDARDDDDDSTAAAAAAAPPVMGDGGIGEDYDERGPRSVSFDKAEARVMFVPTRSELKARDDLCHQQSYHQQHDHLHGLGGRVDCDGGDGGGCNEGIWWTRKDCARFRRSFRRQLCAENLQAELKSFLCPTELVFRVGRGDELLEDEMMMRKKQEEEDDARRRGENGVVVGGAASASGNDCAGGSGGSMSLMIPQSARAASFGRRAPGLGAVVARQNRKQTTTRSVTKRSKAPWSGASTSRAVSAVPTVRSYPLMQETALVAYIRLEVFNRPQQRRQRRWRQSCWQVFWVSCVFCLCFLAAVGSFLYFSQEVTSRPWVTLSVGHGFVDQMKFPFK